MCVPNLILFLIDEIVFLLGIGITHYVCTVLILGRNTTLIRFKFTLWSLVVAKIWSLYWWFYRYWWVPDAPLILVSILCYFIIRKKPWAWPSDLTYNNLSGFWHHFSSSVFFEIHVQNYISNWPRPFTETVNIVRKPAEKCGTIEWCLWNYQSTLGRVRTTVRALSS